MVIRFIVLISSLLNKVVAPDFGPDACLNKMMCRIHNLTIQLQVNITFHWHELDL